MPADTVRIGGQSVNRKALYLAGAIGIGVVGYAWWTRKPQVPEEVVTESELDKMGDERIPTTGVPYDPNVRPTQGITTNAEWAQFATDRLNSLGYDPIAVGDALGKFLTRRPLTPSEANIARAAVAQAGEPPQDRPWPVLLEQPPASVGLLAPTGLAWHWVGWDGNVPKYRLTWNSVSGAADYHVIHPNGAAQVVEGTSAEDVAATPSTPATAKVAARNAAHVIGPYATVSWTPGGLPGQPPPAAPPPAAPPPPSGSPPPAPASLGVLPGPGGRVGLAWPGVPGATEYRYRWETASERSEWAHTTATSVTTYWLFEPGTQFSAVVQAGNAYGWSNPTGGNNAWSQ